MKRILGIGMVAVLLAGCAVEATAPLDARRVPGALLVTGWNAAVPTSVGTGGSVNWGQSLGPTDIGAAQVIVAPDTVTAGEPFEITTYTVGVSGCWRGDGQTLGMQGRVVELRPYDSHSGSEVCTGALVLIDHRSTAQLEEQGAWTLRVHGRRLRMGDETWYEPITAEKPIYVR